MDEEDEFDDLPADLRRFIDDGMSHDDRASFDREGWRDAPRIDDGWDDGAGWAPYGGDLGRFDRETGDDF